MYGHFYPLNVVPLSYMCLYIQYYPFIVTILRNAQTDCEAIAKGTSMDVELSSVD